MYLEFASMRITPFRYVEFCDVPRIILLMYKNRLFLLSSFFDEEADEYEDTYTVDELPASLEKQVSQSWQAIEPYLRAEPLASIPVKEIRFDETKRKFLDASVLDKYLKGL